MKPHKCNEIPKGSEFEKDGDKWLLICCDSETEMVDIVKGITYCPFCGERLKQNGGKKE